MREKILCISQFKKCLEVGKEYYRTRIINPEDDDNEKGIGITLDNKFKGYDDMNSREPILGIGSEGRNSIVGSSYLYIASNPETACVEIKSQLMLRFTQPVRGENAYRATQIIADYLRKTGIDGIKYKSFLTPEGANYTIFNSTNFNELVDFGV